MYLSVFSIRVCAVPSRLEAGFDFPQSQCVPDARPIGKWKRLVPGKPIQPSLLYKLSIQIYHSSTVNVSVPADWEAFKFLSFYSSFVQLHMGSHLPLILTLVIKP